MSAKPTPIRRIPSARIEEVTKPETPNWAGLTMQPYRLQQALYRETLEMLARRAELNAEYLHRLAVTETPLAALALSGEFISQSFERSFEMATKRATTLASLIQNEQSR